MRYKNILLDFDDTLIDTQGFASKCLWEMYGEHDLGRYFDSHNHFLKCYHDHIRQLWEDYSLGVIDKSTLLKERFQRVFSHLPEVDSEFITTLNGDFMTRVVQIDRAIDGAKELLCYLKDKGYKLVMLSNGFTELQYRKMKNVGFEGLFDEIILSDVVGVNKPHPQIFELALGRVGGTAQNSIMIGDNYLADIQGAMNAGMDQVWYNAYNEEVEVAPTYTVYHLKDIMQIL